MMADLSDSWRVGVERIDCSLVSCFMTLTRDEMAREVLSRADCFAAAVYCGALSVRAYGDRAFAGGV